MTITNLLRRNVGTIVAIFGFLLLCIMTFGNLGEILSDVYWKNVSENLTSIGFVSVGLTLIQVSIKQGLAEQALQRGLNTERTAQKYEEHKSAIKSCFEKMPYLPYFLQMYNKRHTHLRRQDFLINNGFTTETALLRSHRRRLISKYKEISTNITASSIKWSSVEVIYNKDGRIITLEEYRLRRVRNSVIVSLIGMIGLTFLTGGLFFSPSDEPIGHKFIKLFTYIIAIAMSVIFSTVREYEKGAFGVPNELDEINQIWFEFNRWTIPTWVTKEIENFDKEVTNNGKKDIDDRTNLSEE